MKHKYSDGIVLTCIEHPHGPSVEEDAEFSPDSLESVEMEVEDPFAWMKSPWSAGNYQCPVCGYGMEVPPENYNICSCCGVEFGYNDVGRSHRELRDIWISEGAKWWSEYNPPPQGWDPIVQLRKLLPTDNE
jgi:hypothetical protein